MSGECPRDALHTGSGTTSPELILRRPVSNSRSLFRAVENSVPIPPAANTGKLGFINANGQALDNPAIFTEAALIRSVIRFSAATTVRNRSGNVVAGPCALVSIGLLGD